MSEKKIPATAYQTLAFPLNVYAYCLLLEQGEVNYLHYGLFDKQHTSPQQAQQFSTELLKQHLPQPPCHILEIGTGLATTAKLLGESGYQVTTLCPDSAQFAIAQQGLDEAENVCLLADDYGQFAAKNRDVPPKFDLLLCQESAQYIDALDLFNHALELLKPQGQILIMDEFSLKRTNADQNTLLPVLATVKNQAQRCGFKLLTELDLSAQAAPTTDYLLQVINRHQHRLLHDLPINTEMLSHLLESTRLYQHGYRQGRYGYVLLHWVKDQAPRWRVTVAKAENEGAIRQLFAQVFAKDMSHALWAWKYADGRGMATLAWKGDELVAHYGGLLRRLWFLGELRPGVQIGDVMVSPQERGVLTRKSAFFQTAATFPERWVGYGQQVFLGFGFPNFHAMKVAERLGLYAEVGRMAEIHWPALSTRARLLSTVRLLTADEGRLPAIVAELWTKMAEDLSHHVVGVRDWAYVRHRYAQHPQRNYHFLWVKHRWSGQSLGLAIVWRDGEQCQLLDFIGSLLHLKTTLLQTRRVLASWQLAHMTTWVSDGFKPDFLAAGGVEHPLDVRIPTSIWTQGVAAETLKNRWWLTLGDTDFN